MGCLRYAWLILIFTASCATSGSSPAISASSDPFVGFFAHPSSGMLELKCEGGAKYSGSLWADFGPFPVDAVRNGNVLEGTVMYGGAAHPLRIENTTKGLILTADGTRAEAPLQRYASMEAYQKWFSAQGGYQATITVDPATTQPGR